MDDKRKHREQMTADEIILVEHAVRRFKDFSISPHTLERMFEKGVYKSDVADALSQGRVIEAHNNVPNDVRALMQLDRQNDRVSVVISLITGEVKTVWLNHITDTHATRDKSKYKWAVSLFQVLSPILNV